MTYTIVTLTLVGIILLFWLYKLMFNCFCRSFSIWKNEKNGSITFKEATILSVNIIKNGKKPLLELLVVFENLSGYPIHRKIRVWDSKPHLDRFRPDEKIPIGLNIAKKPKDPVFLALGEHRISFSFVVLCCLKIVLYVTGCYILMGEALERIFASPTKYEQIFTGSDVWKIGSIFIAIVVFLYFFLHKIGLLEKGTTTAKNWDLLYKGMGAPATIKMYQDTGALINDNPLIRLEYKFEDMTGLLIQGADKKIVGKLEIGTLPDLEKLDIMYLPENPTISRLVENLENDDLSKFVNALFFFVLFIFSVFIVALFYQSIF